MQLIVNADDFGKSEDVNRAISECFDKGYIDRTTIMVNMPFAEKACEMAKEKGFFDKVGLHINLTEGQPLTEGIKNNPLFCDENGQYNAAFYRSTRLRLHMDRASVNDIYNELKAQIDKYIEFGFTLNHIDSHHHVHTNYPVLKALKSLSREYEFKSIRLSRNLYFGGGFLSRKYKEIYNNSVKKICDNTTEYFGSYVDAQNYRNEINKTDASAFKKFTNEHSLEVMVHPMYSLDGVLVDTEVPFEEEILLYEAIR